MITRTKIICTIGPVVNSKEKIVGLMQAGMNVARLNFSHGTHEQHLETIGYLKEARQQLEQPLAIMLDTKGPEIRLGNIKERALSLKRGCRWRLVKEEVYGDAEKVTVKPAEVLNDLKEGMAVLFADGAIASHVIEVSEEGVTVEIEDDGILSSGKGINIPNTKLGLPAVTEKDIEDIRFGCQCDIDIIAASFVRSADHVVTIKKLLAREGRSNILVIAKIENAEGIANFDSIVQVADGIMIARGDLGVEVDLTQVPGLQKKMIKKSNLAGKPSVTATQMLRSMVSHPIPSRAETSDVANAIYDSTSAVMLSEETAVGEYPIEAVKIMKAIIVEAEKDCDYGLLFEQHAKQVYKDIPSSLTLACVKTAYGSDAKAIFAFTASGLSARLLSRLRPKMPIIGMTPSMKTYHQMALYWGVRPLLSDKYYSSIQEAFDVASQQALDEQIIGIGDLVLVIGGSRVSVPGSSNMMIVENIGDVLVRGYEGWGTRSYGQVAFAFSSEETKPFMVRDQIIVMTKCDETFLPLLRESKGVILQNGPEDEASEQCLMKMRDVLNDKPVIIRADGATSTLHERQFVTIDPEKAIVYKGVLVDDKRESS